MRVLNKTIFVRVSALVTLVLFCTGCATLFHRNANTRRIISTYSLWDGMGPPNTDRRFPELQCKGTLTITTLDVTFQPGASPACSTPMHQRTTGTLPYGELREIRLTKRPEVLIFKAGTNPPALRVTDWENGPQYRRAVKDLQVAYKEWQRHHKAQ